MVFKSGTYIGKGEKQEGDNGDSNNNGDQSCQGQTLVDDKEYQGDQTKEHQSSSPYFSGRQRRSMNSSPNFSQRPRRSINLSANSSCISRRWGRLKQRTMDSSPSSSHFSKRS